jgi:hypothetical protein
MELKKRGQWPCQGLGATGKKNNTNLLITGRDGFDLQHKIINVM